VVGAVLVLVTARAGVALGSASLAAPERHPASRVVAVPSVTVVVRPGDSLWAIARRVAPDEDPRVVVDELEQARHDAPLVPGESITWTG
jgi:Tfp pilus assembly protein FimV